MNQRIKSYVDEHYELMLTTLRELCQIPAPSHHEDARAAYCKQWLESIGATNVAIDEAKNVLFGINCEQSDNITVIAAHTDVVFPDTTPLPMREDDEKIYCPGVSDDTANLIVLMTLAKFFVENTIKPRDGILFVCDTCEEGLGNLKGVRQIFKDYAGRVRQFVSLDGGYNCIRNHCVGSHRYKIEVTTEGGHSYSKFGNKNAIAVLADIVSAIYAIEVPQKEGTHTTYNVGTISGGNSVNTIAQNAQMLCEYRSDDIECLAVMKEKFAAIFEDADTQDAKVTVTLVGERPCADINKQKVDDLVDRVMPVFEEVLGTKLPCLSSSTDCNIPLSLGIPAFCVGTCIEHGAHTREEWVDKASMRVGLEIAIKMALKLTEETI